MKTASQISGGKKAYSINGIAQNDKFIDKK